MANLGRTFDSIIPVVRGHGIEQFIWIANRSRLFLGAECGPPLRTRIVIRAGDGRLISDNNYHLGRDEQLRVNVSDRLELPAQSDQVTVGTARIERQWAEPGKRGTTRPQFEIVAKRSTCSVHSLMPGIQPETWLTLMWRPAEERLLFLLVNGEVRPIEVEFAYPFPSAVAEESRASSHVVTLPGRGASRYELRLDPEASERLRDKPFAVRYRCKARYKPYMMVASPSLERLSIDHVVVGMQLYTYLFPEVVSIPRGYSCSIAIPYRLVAHRLHRHDAEILAVWTVISEGKELMRREGSFGNPERGGAPKPELVFDWQADQQGAGDAAVFAEVEIASRAQVPCFSNRMPVVSYSLCWKSGRKSVLCSTAYKYGSPQIIDMMADFGTFAEGFPAIHIDRSRDISQSLAFINPYLKPIVVDVVTGDERTLPRIRIAARSVHYCNLATVLRPGEDRWLGQVQLKASNRLITYVYKHSFSDPTMVSDQEHMDPYRSDPTHYPLTQQWRLLFGELMRRRRARA